MSGWVLSEALKQGWGVTIHNTTQSQVSWFSFFLWLLFLTPAFVYLQFPFCPSLVFFSPLFLITFSVHFLIRATSSVTTRSTHFRQGSFSLMTCFFTIASNAMSGVNRPVLWQGIMGVTQCGPQWGEGALVEKRKSEGHRESLEKEKKDDDWRIWQKKTKQQQSVSSTETSCMFSHFLSPLQWSVKSQHTSFCRDDRYRLQFSFSAI